MKTTTVAHKGTTYREVSRKAVVGELIRVFKGYSCMYDAGVHKVVDVDRVDHVQGARIATKNGGDVYMNTSEYSVLEPIENEVGRMAKVGDRIKIVKSHNSEVTVGSVLTVKQVDREGDIHEVSEQRLGGSLIFFYVKGHRLNEYVVLEPVTPTATTQPSDDRVTALESRVAELERRVIELTPKQPETVAASQTSQPLTRADVIERAKSDIVELPKQRHKGVLVDNRLGTTVEYVPPGSIFSDHVEYEVNREQRTVVAMLRSTNGGTVWRRGQAVCGPDDVFNVHIGKAIAIRRALGLDVPTEYTKAPQPTERRVGDIIEVEWQAAREKRKLCLVSPSESIKLGKTCGIGSVYGQSGRIIDDSGDSE